LHPERTVDQNVKGAIFSAAQAQIAAMLESGEIQVSENDAPDCVTEKLDATAWYPLAKLNTWTAQIRDLVGASNLEKFGFSSAARLGETGIYNQFEVTLEEQGFSLGSKLLLTFAGISHPYTEWTFAEADAERGVVIDVRGSSGWNDEQSAITLGWVDFLARKMYGDGIRSRWERTAAGDVRYHIEVL